MQLFFVDEGKGLPVIFCHGGLANHQSVRMWAAPLASRFRVVTPDLRGSGKSHFAGELTWDLLADDIAELARDLGISRAVVGGISFGAGCAVRVALRHPQLLAGLALVHPAFAGEDLALTAAQTAAMAAMKNYGERTLTGGMTALFPLLDALPAELRERARAVVATYDPASVAATTRFMGSHARPFTRASELAAITAPALVVPGIDAQHPLEVSAVYRAHLPRCTTVETPDLATALADFVGTLYERAI